MLCSDVEKDYPEEVQNGYSEKLLDLREKICVLRPCVAVSVYNLRSAESNGLLSSAPRLDVRRGV